MKLHYDQRDLLELKRHITNTYDAHRDDIQLMIEHEHTDCIDYFVTLHGRTRTQKTASDAQTRADLFRVMVQELEPAEIIAGLCEAYRDKSEELLGLLGGVTRSEQMLRLVRDLREVSTEGV